MTQNLRYILIAVGVVAVVLVIWTFIHIVAYVLISAVLALIGRPIVEFLRRMKIRKWLRALIVLMVFWTVFVMFFYFVIPLVSSELNNLAQIDTQNVMSELKDPILWLENTIDKYTVGTQGKFTVQDFLTQQISSLLSATFLTNFFSETASALGNIFVAIFSITFITYFFLRDEKLFANALLVMVPDKHVKSFSHAMESTRRLLVRYFISILVQITGIFTIVTTGLTIVGMGFGHSLLIGLLAAVLNVIPYLGPFLGGALGITLGVITHLQLDFYSELMPLTVYTLVVFMIAQLTDNFIFQPLIYSSSVNAHPLEIFLVIMLAGSLAGISGMILAIPTYTVLRVFAKEFFNKFKVVKKLTSKIE